MHDATMANSITTGTVKITESETTDQKYLLIKVPNFARDPSGDPDAASENHGRKGDLMTSYIRLGVASTTREPGDELIPHAFTAGPAGMHEFVGDADGYPVATDSPFIDDHRNRGDGNVEPRGASGHGLTPAQRIDLHSKHLLTKGGWRDHSDGNRISTTYGDKIEVIRGNYKMVVMGRQDDPGNAIGNDMSGNHLQDFAQATMPGASVTVEWIKNAYDPGAPIPLGGGETFPGGAWLLINSTERVYQYSRNAGNFREQVWGDKNETYIGSENPQRIGLTDDAGYLGHPPPPIDGATHSVSLDAAEFQTRIRPSSKGLPRGNPHIIEKTWAVLIESYTGSLLVPIPKIIEQTYAVTTESLTNVTGNTVESTVVGGNVSSETKVTGTVTETTTVTGAVTETTTMSSSVTSTTTMTGPVTETTTSLGPITSTTAATAITETTGAAVVTSTTIAGATVDVAVAGAMVDVSVGAIKVGIDVAAVVIDLTLGLAKLTAEANIICLEMYTGVKFELEASKGTKMTPDGEEIAINKKTVGGNVQIMAGTIQLN